MRYSLYILCALLFCLSGRVSAQNKDQSVLQTTSLLQATSEVRDVATLNFADLSGKTDATWIVAQIQPGPFSGSRVIKGFYQDADSGKFVQVSGGRDVIRVNGTFRVLAALMGKPEKRDYAYQWEFPHNVSSRPNKANSVKPFELFISGGIAVFPLPQDLHNSAQALPIYSVPAQWQEFVLPAWQYYQANSALFEQRNAMQNRDQLQQLLEHNNPLLAVAACRTLSQSRLLDQDFINGSLLQTTQLRQAVFTFVLLDQLSQRVSNRLSEDELLTAIQQTIGNADAEKLAGIALGALTALRNLDYDGSVRAFRVLEAIEKKPLRLGTSSESTRFIATVIQMASLPLLRLNLIHNGTAQPKR